MSELPPRSWRETTLGKAAEIVMGQSPPGYTYNQNGRGVPLINGPVEFGNRFPIKIQWTSAPSKTCLDGDILFCVRGSTTGRINVSNDTYCIGRGLAALRGRDGISDTGFLELLLRQLAVDILEEARGSGSTFPSITGSRLAQRTFLLPPLLQQRKIAQILATVDNLIEKTEALVTKYQAIKQGMMHDLFTHGVDERGHLRPPYEEAPELYKQSEMGWIPKPWDCLGFGDFIVSGPQNGLYKSNSSYSVDGSPIVRIDGFYDGKLCDVKSFRRLHLTRAELAAYMLEADDILVNRVNSIDFVGKSAIVPQLLESTVFESNIMRLKVNRERLLPCFAIRLLCHHTTQRQFCQSAKSAVAQASINQSDIRRCFVAVPKLSEQIWLIERCRSIECQIDWEKNYLVKLRRQKSGVMQDLLSGKVRVSVDEAEEFIHV